MKIDLHVHTSERSNCAVATAEEQIKAAIEKGLDAIVITDHDCMVEKQTIAELNHKFAPFKIYGGCEIRINTDGYNEDVLVVGVHDKELCSKTWTYDKLHKFVIEQNGFIALAHPYRYTDFISIDVENYPPHAIELYSSNVGIENAEMRIELAKKLGCNLITNSDGHSIDKVGIYYNVLERVPADEKELVEMLINETYSTFGGM